MVDPLAQKNMSADATRVIQGGDLVARHNGSKRRPQTLQSLASGRSEAWFLRGYATFHCLFALSQIGFFDEMAAHGALALDAYASARQLDVDKLEAIARYLFGLGILNRDAQGRYSTGVEICKEDLATVELFYAYDPLFHNLAPLLRKEKVYGKDIHRLPELDARATARICGTFCYPKLIEIIEQKGARQVMDLGCGSAELLIQLCQRSASVQGYGIDISPEAIQYARSRISEAQLWNQIKVGVGDIFNLHGDGLFTAAGKPRVDLILSTSVFHEFAYKGTQGLVKALEGVRREFEGVEVILFEAQEQPDESLREKPSGALEHHLFHRLSSQGIASVAEWRLAFEQAGYRLQGEIYLPPGGMIFVLE